MIESAVSWIRKGDGSLVEMRASVRLVSVMIWLCTFGWIAKAQDPPQDAVPRSATGQTPEAVKPDWDEIDQRLVFLTVQLSTVESSIAATRSISRSAR